MDVGKAGGMRGAARKLRDCASPRPSTTGDLPTSSPLSGSIAGGIQGYLTGGPVMAGAGLAGGWVGVKVGEKTGSFALAVGTGAVVGGALAVGAAMSPLAAVLGAPVGPAGMGVAALLGGFTGAVGTLSGSRRASTRDGVYGGMVMGALARVFVPLPGLVIAGSVGGGVGGKAPTVVGRVILGTLAGAASGAMSGILGGPAVMVPSALVGAGVGALGAVIGPVFRQVQRNMTEDLTRKLISRIDPYVEKHPLTKGQKIAIGATAGALTFGPLGLLFGLPGLGVAAGAGAVVGAASTWSFLRKRDRAEAAARTTAGPQPPASSPRGPQPPAAPHPSPLSGMSSQEIAQAWAEGRLPRMQGEGSLHPPGVVGPEPPEPGLERPARPAEVVP